MPSKLPPGPRKSVRNSIQWVRQPAATMEAARQRYGDVWALQMAKVFGGGATFVVVSDPELVGQVLTADEDVLRAGEANKMVGEALLGQHSLILLDGEEHAAQRKLLLPQFHGERVQRYKGQMERFCEEDLASWPLNEPMELLPRMQDITLHAIMSNVFGMTEEAHQSDLVTRIRELQQFTATGMKVAMMHIANRIGRYPKSFVRARDRVDEAIFEAVDRARNDPRLEEREDVLALLIQARHGDGSPMSDRELRDQLITLLLQGHQSTATALAWALERLMRHPEALERVRAEAQTGGEEYLDAVVKETLRVRPPVGLVMRMVRQPFQLGEYEIEPGALIAPCIYLIHRHERVWPEPERFRPERFLEGKVHKYAWIPFGSGDRHCIGRTFATTEIKVVLRTIALRARFAPVEEPDEEIVRAGIMFSPSRGARAVLRERVPAAQAATATG